MSFLKHFLVMLGILVARVNAGTVVQTNTGPVQGKMVSHGKVQAFLGIPYAEPPIGPLRFSKPVPKKPWQEVYDATRLPPACIQIKQVYTPYVPNTDNMSEDCLYLNLWMPISQSSYGELKTIMLFIHGGGLLFGASNLPVYDGAKLAEYGDVIVVTFNYRLGGLGFLTDFTDDAPGSAGMYDQVMAIEWIKNNAWNFNGDPENIVLFGQSAGGIAITHHQISPLSQNLFKRAILESGSGMKPVPDYSNSQFKANIQLYVKLAGCKYDVARLGNRPKDVIECLRQLPAEMFSQLDMEVFKKRNQYPLPLIGNDFLPESAVDAFRKGHFKNSEVLMGTNRNEGNLFVAKVSPDYFDELGYRVSASKFSETVAINSTKTAMTNIKAAEVDKVIRVYMDDVTSETNYTYLNAATDAVADNNFICSNIFQAEYQSMSNNPVYLYVFTHRPTISPYAPWVGVAHFDEVQFVFGNPLFSFFTEYEIELSRNIMALWITFAKTGNPNIGDVSWPRYTYQQPNYLILGQSDRSIGLRPDNCRCERWRDVFRSDIHNTSLNPCSASIQNKSEN